MMQVTITHDDSLAAVGFAALLREVKLDVLLKGHIHIVSVGLPWTAEQHQRLSCLSSHNANACIVLESLPDHPRIACLREGGNRVFIVNARLSLPTLRVLASHILLRMELSQEEMLPWRDKVYHQMPHRPHSALSRTHLTRMECLTLCYLLTGRKMALLSRHIKRSIKTVAGYKAALSLRLNAFTPAGLHMRLCMERGIQPPSVTSLYRIGDPVPPGGRDDLGGNELDVSGYRVDVTGGGARKSEYDDGPGSPPSPESAVGSAGIHIMAVRRRRETAD